MNTVCEQLAVDIALVDTLRDWLLQEVDKILYWATQEEDLSRS